ncbi:hypothetical protein AB7M63_003627 [Bradyrhizobium japonicum]
MTDGSFILRTLAAGGQPSVRLSDVIQLDRLNDAIGRGFCGTIATRSLSGSC